MARDGKSPRCQDHREQRRQWAERQRQRRASMQHYIRQQARAIRGEIPEPQRPLNEDINYTPNPLLQPQAPGLTLTRQQTHKLKTVMKLIENLNIEASQAARKGTAEEKATYLDEFLEQTAVLHLLLRKPLSDGSGAARTMRDGASKVQRTSS